MHRQSHTCIKNRMLSYDMDHDFFLRMMVNYLKSLSSSVVEEGKSFKDFITKEHCRKIHFQDSPEKLNSKKSSVIECSKEA